jgi:hypothetical protein
MDRYKINMIQSYSASTSFSIFFPMVGIRGNSKKAKAFRPEAKDISPALLSRVFEMTWGNNCDRPVEPFDIGKKGGVVQSAGRTEDQAALPEQGPDLPERGLLQGPVDGCRRQPGSADAADQTDPRTVAPLKSSRSMHSGSSEKQESTCHQLGQKALTFPSECQPRRTSA